MLVYVVAAADPASRNIQHHEVGHGRKKIADQSLAVAPEPIPLLPRGAPAVVLPALQRDTCYPAAALPDGGPERSRKEFARCDRPRMIETNRDEKLPAAQRAGDTRSRNLR